MTFRCSPQPPRRRKIRKNDSGPADLSHRPQSPIPHFLSPVSPRGGWRQIRRWSRSQRPPPQCLHWSTGGGQSPHRGGKSVITQSLGWQCTTEEPVTASTSSMPGAREWERDRSLGGGLWAVQHTSPVSRMLGIEVGIDAPLALWIEVGIDAPLALGIEVGIDDRSHPIRHKSLRLCSRTQ